MPLVGRSLDWSDWFMMSTLLAILVAGLMLFLYGTVIGWVFCVEHNSNPVCSFNTESETALGAGVLVYPITFPIYWHRNRVRAIGNEENN